MDVGSYGGLFNTGTLINTGALNNSGSFVNEIDGYLNNSGYLYISSAGYLDSFGALDNESTGFLENDGYLYNSGNLHNNGPLYNSGTLANDGYLKNYGTLENFDTLENYGPLINYGSLNNNGYLYNSGNLASLDNEGTLNNNGYLYNIGSMDNGGDGGGSLNNSGILNNDGGVLTGNGTYIQTAGQTINNGTMTQSLFDFQGGEISGNGTFNGSVNIAAGVIVTPGNSPGTLVINGDLNSSGDYVFQIAGAAPGQYDVLQINGTAMFSGGHITFEFTDGYTGNLGDSFGFFVANSSSGGNNLTWSIVGLGAGLGYEFSYAGNTSYLNITTVPEAETYAMMLVGLGLVGFMARRRKQVEA